MAAPPIRIRIGASLDASVNRSFSAIEKRAQKAQGVVVRERQRSAKAEEREAQRAAKAQEREAERGARAHERAAEREARAHERSAARWLKSMEGARRKAERELDAKARAAERAAEREARAVERSHRRQGQAFARRTSHRATRFLMPNAPMGTMALGHARSLARGAGVETDLGSVMGRTIGQEEMATKISNKAFRPGEAGAAGQRVDPAELTRQARNVAFDVGGDTTGMLNALFAFTSQSGDLQTARNAMLDLAKLAKSQGADFEDTFFAAGKINNALEQQPEFMHDSEKRAREVFKVMNLLIAQTKIGSIEFDKLGKEIPKIAGIAGIFTGSTETSLGQLATILQVAEKGQAPNAAVAATQVSNFALDLQKASNAKRFEVGGRNISLRAEDGRTREAKEIIIDILRVAESEAKSKGTSETAVITDLLRNKRSFLPLIDFLSIFKNAGGGESGIAAIEKTFADFGKSISAKQLEGDFTAAVNTTASKVNRFNTQVEDVADNLRAKLLPAFEQATPLLLSFAETVGAVTTWTAKNPKLAIGAAIGAAVARAGIESAFRAGIEKAIVGGTGARAAGAGRAAGMAGAGLGAVGAGLALGAITSIVVERFVAKQTELQEVARGESQSAFELEKKADTAMNEGRFSDAERFLSEAKEMRLSALENLKTEQDEGGVGRSILEFVEWVRGNQADVETQRNFENQRIEAQQQALEQTRDLLRNIRDTLSNGIDVNNLPDGGGGIPGRVSQE